MTLAEIRRVLEQNTTNGRLRLMPTALGSDAIARLCARFVWDEHFEVSNAQISAVKNNVLVLGQSTVFAQTGVPVEARFSLRNQEAHLSVRAMMPQGWRFADSFPFTEDANLNELMFSEATFLLDSAQDESKQCFFAGDLHVDGILKEVTGLLNDAVSRHLTGHIAVEDNLPRMALSSDAEIVKIGHFHMPLSLSFATDIFKKDAGDVGSVSSEFVLTANLPLKINTRTVTVPISTRFNRYVGARTFRADLEEASLAALSQISGLLDGVDVLKSLPTAFRPDKNLALAHFEFTVIPRLRQLAAIGLSVKTTQAWKLFDDFAIEGVTLEIRVSNPTRKSSRQVQCAIVGVFALGDQQKIAVSAGFPSFDLLGFLPEGATLKLKPLIQRFLPHAQEVPEATINDLDLSVQPTTKTFSLRAGLKDEWQIGTGKTSVTIQNLGLVVERTHNGVAATSATLSGSARIGDLTLDMGAAIGDAGGFTWRGQVAGLSLRSIVTRFFPGDLELPAEIPAISFKSVDLAVTAKTGDFSVSGQGGASWQIPIGVSGLHISNLHFSVARPGGQGARKTVAGVIGGTLTLGSASFAVHYNFPGEFVLTGDLPRINLSALLQELCGGDVIRDLPVPATVLSATLTGLRFSIAPQSRRVSIAATSEFGQVEINVKNIGRKWGFSVAFAPPAKWKFSALAKELTVLDGLRFSNTVLVLVSADDHALAVTSLSAPARVTKGFNFVAHLDLSGLGADEVLKIKTLQVAAAIGGNPTNIALEASIAGRVQIDRNTAFGDMRLRLVPAPQNFSLTLLGTVFARIGTSSLEFVGGMQIQPRSALFQGTMLGNWQEPFDTKGVIVSNVALEVGMSFPPPLPSLGFAGTLQVGEFAGAVAVKFDSAMPSRSMLAVAFNQLYLMDVIKQFCGPGAAQNIPQSLQKTILDIGFENVNIYIVPQPTTIGELKFEQGFTVQGRMRLVGLYASAHVNLDYTNGVLIKGDVDEVHVAGVFKLTGARGQEKAALSVDLRRGQTPSVDVQGAVQLLGFRSETVVKISDQGFYFVAQGNIFNLFEATLEAQGGDLKNAGDFMLAVSMRQDLFAYLREKASAAIDAAAQDAVRKISDAQRDVDRAQAEINRLLGEIENMRQVIRAERERDQQRLQAAQAEVQKAQKQVNTLNAQIDQMRRTIQAERVRDTARIQAAQREVQKAQDEVNRLQSEINRAKDRIAALQRAIKAKEQWYNNLGFWDKANPANWGVVVAENTPRVAEISGLGVEIGALEAAKHTAWGVLEAAKGVLRGIEAGAQTFPIDADPRMVGLLTAHGSAWVALEAAKGVLRGIEAAAQTVPIEADPRMVGLFTAYGSATGALQAARGVLEGVKLTVGGLADVGQFIIDVGLGGLIDVKSASFRTSLAVANGGRVAMNIDVLFMKKERHTLTLDFSFADPLSAANALAKSLLPA